MNTMKRKSGDPRIGVNRSKISTGTLRACLSLPGFLMVICLLSAGCGNNQRSNRYDAEKALHSARKMREDILRGSFEEAFLERALQSYRGIVTEYSTGMDEVEGLRDIVVSAQMDLAELEFRTGMLVAARDDFEKAIDLAADVPPARANAFYSCGVISEEMREPDEAILYYERFADEFLAPGKLAGTARMNSRYLVTPLKLFSLYNTIGREKEAAAWLQKAEEIYRSIIESESNEAILKETRFNLLTAYLQGKKWKQSLEYVRELAETYPGGRDIPALIFLEAKIEKDGFGEKARAIDLFMELYNKYADSPEAPRALLAVADIHLGDGRYEEAHKIYKKVVDEYPTSSAEAVQAEWQIAQILEKRGQWSDASLKYKSIYQSYPRTEQGLKAPLIIIRNYLGKNQQDAAEAAYLQAVDHYERLISSQEPVAVKILAESHLVTAHADMERWEEAASSLLQLPGKYPMHARFMQNYLLAASIYEKELGDPARAAEALRACMETYPGTPLAEEAEKQYRRLEDSK
jgi:tetratricopeptide (TPR) repeat protein